MAGCSWVAGPFGGWMYINVMRTVILMSLVAPPVLMDMAKEGLNVCPICWMPLYIGDGDEANVWCQVQVLFKNKPSEST